MLAGCGSTTVNTTTIEKSDSQRPMLPPPPPPEMVAPMKKAKIKKIETSTGVPQYGPNIYKSASGGACSGASCVTPQYDVTQDKCTDFPVSYRAKRQIIEKDIVLVKE
jgi:hypothetical protein